MIRVVIVDDQKVITQGLKVLLESEPDIEIVATGSNGKEAIQLATDLQPDVLLIDQNMPIMMGIDAVRIICGRFPSLAVLLLSGSDEDGCIADALQAGAKGYLLKTTSAEDLASSIRSVHRGYSQMGPGLLEKLLARVNPAADVGSIPAMGTPVMATAAQSVTVSQPPTLLNAELLQILNTPAQFEVESLAKLLSFIDESNAATTCMAQLETQLQQNPNHVSGFYLAGRLIYQQQRNAPLSMKYLRMALKNCQMQNFPLSVVFHICQAAWDIDSQETFRWLDKLLAEWSLNQSSRTFFETLRPVFAPSTDLYRLLKMSWEMRHLRALCDDVNALQSKLNSPITKPTVVA